MKIIANNKLLLKILSALIAVILWIAITYSEDPIINQTLNGIKLEFTGEDELQDKGLIVTNKDSMPMLSAVIRGNRSKVISAMGTITAIANVADISEAGTSTVSVEYTYPSSSVNLLKTRISEVSVETEKIVTRNIPVKIEIINQEKNLTHTVKSDAGVTSLKIKGAESEMYKISYAKVQVDAENISKTSRQDYVYKFYDEKDNAVPDVNIIYRNHKTINVENTVYTKMTLPVEAVLADAYSEDYGLIIKSISKSAVDVGVEDGAEPTAVYAVMTDISAENGKYELKLQEQDGVYIPEKNKDITVVCEVVPKVIKEIEIPVKVINLPDGKTCTLAEDKIKVSVKGIEKEISADKISAVLDASAVGDGKNVVTVTVTAEDGMAIIGAYTAEIEIK